MDFTLRSRIKSCGESTMKFRITLIYLQKITIFLLFLIYLSCEIQAEAPEDEPGTYRDLTEALQNSLDVRILILSEQKLTTLPKKIEQLKNLQMLDLCYNQFKTVPKKIEQLKNLQMLDLCYNQFKTVPKKIGQLKNLQVLNLSSNQLTTLPKE
ncbi:leucine-rich repeat domain-containing protein, partial [Leptospira interrogans]